MRILKAKEKNKRVYLFSNDEDKFRVMFHTLDTDYQGIKKYVHHGILRNKVVYTGISMSRFAAKSIMFMLADLLGYEIIKNNKHEN